MEHTKPIIPRTKIGKEIVGKHLKCRKCGQESIVTLEEKTYYLVTCFTCGDKARLKEYNI